MGAYELQALMQGSTSQKGVVGFVSFPSFPSKSASEWVSSDMFTVNVPAFTKMLAFPSKKKKKIFKIKVAGLVIITASFWLGYKVKMFYWLMW